MLKLAENLELPLDFMTERIAFLARTGAGKSGGMRVMFEQIFDAGQFVIFIDPKGDAYGIRAAGVGKGKPVLIMGGDHADVPLEATAGKVIAEFLVRERVSTVLDISDLSTPEMWRFVADFTKALYRLNREALHLFIDEADMIAGQTYFDPHCLHGIQLIQNKGRGRGFGVTVATQRPQILNKTVLNASGTLIAMQMIGDDALKVVKSWLSQSGTKEAAAEILAEIPKLQTREAFVYSPQILGIEPRRIKFAQFQTFDSMRTPKPGEARQVPKSLADIDLASVQRDMAATIEKAKAEDPKLLKAEIAQLRKELDAERKASPEAPAPVEIQVPVLDEKGLDKLEKAANDLFDSINRAVGEFAMTMQDAAGKFGRLRTKEFSPFIEEIRSAKLKSLPAALISTSNEGTKKAQTENPRTETSSDWKTQPKTTPNRKEHEQRGDATVSNPQQKLLDTLALFESFGVTEVKRTNLAAFAGVSPRSSGFEKNLSTLRNHADGGLIEYGTGSVVMLTELGRVNAGMPNIQVAQNEDLLNAWCSNVISNPQAILLRILFDRRSELVSRDELADLAEVSVKSSGFEKNLSTLRSLGLIDYGAGRTVFVTDLLFPFSQ